MYNPRKEWENADIFVFKNGAPYQMQVPDGRAIYSGGTWIYEFDYKDHLGNTRVSFRANGSNLERSAATDFDPWGVRLNGTGTVNAFQNRWEMQGKEKESTFNLNRINFGARVYNPTIGRFDKPDPMATAREWVSTYNYVQNNPVSRIDPDGAFDFVQKEDGEIYWDKNANNQATTKAGETYLGKTLTFTFNSYIDKKSWDGPTMGGMVDPSGNKLTSSITLTGNENSSGELTSITAKMKTSPGETPMGTARNFYPGQGGSNNVFDLRTTSTGISLNFERHASVSPSEELGLKGMGFNIVDVAQKLNIDYNKSSGSLSVSAATNIFPSASLHVNDRQLMQYNQPSFIGTHTTPIIGRSSPSSGSIPVRNFSYYPSKFYKRN